jgi:hypothetical protein
MKINSFILGYTWMITSFKYEHSQILAPGGYTCNPSYLGGWDQKDYGLRPAKAKVSKPPISTNSWAWWCMPVIPKYTGNWDQEDCGCRAAWAKKYGRPHLSRKKLNMVHTCHPTYCGKHKIGEPESRLAWEKARPISKISKAERAEGPTQALLKQ